MEAIVNTVVIIIMVTLILTVIYLMLIMPSMRRHKVMQRCCGRQFAHRGLHNRSKGIPENTLAAYKAAIEKGFGIEFDVRLTADGIPVVMHDPNTKRMTGTDLKVNDTKFADLKGLRISGSKEHIPTLEEVLSLVKGQIPLVVELKIDKNNFEELGSKVFEQLDKYKGDYVIECFDPRMLSWVRHNRPRAVRGQLVMYYRRHGDKNMPAIVDFITHTLITNVIARPDFVSIYYPDRGKLPLKLCRLLGAYEWDWTVTSQKQLDTCRDDGVETTIFEGFIPDSK